MSLTTTLPTATLSYGAQCPNCHRTPTYGIFLRSADGLDLICQDCAK